MIALHNTPQGSLVEECINPSPQAHYTFGFPIQNSKELSTNIYYSFNHNNETFSTAGTNQYSTGPSLNKSSSQSSFSSYTEGNQAFSCQINDGDLNHLFSGAYNQPKSKFSIQPECSIAINLPPKKAPKSRKLFNDKEIEAMQKDLYNDSEALSFSRDWELMTKKVCKDSTKSRTYSTTVSSPTCTFSSDFSSPTSTSKHCHENDFPFNPINYSEEEDLQKRERLVLELLRIEREENQIKNDFYPQDGKRKVLEAARNDDNVKMKNEKKEEKRNPQNERRNMPGLITMRVINGVKKFLKGKSAVELDYIRRLFSQKGFEVNSTSRSEFLGFLKTFSGGKKTYEWVRVNTLANLVYGRLLRECVDAFLSREGRKAFDIWIKCSKMGEEAKMILKTNKRGFKEKLEEKVWALIAGL